MDNSNNSNKRIVTEREINILELISYIIRRWKFVFVIAVVIAALGGLYGYLKDSSNAKKRYTAEDIEKAKESLAESEISEVEKLYAGYTTYNDELDVVQEYIDTSLKVKPEYTGVLTVQYFYESDRAGMLETFNSYAFSDEVYSKIADVYGLDEISRYVYEMVSVNGSEDKSEYQIDTNAGSSILGIDNISTKYNGSFKVVITAKSEEQSEQVYEIVNAAFMNRLKDVRETGVSVDIRQSGKNYTADYREEEIDSILRANLKQRSEIIGAQAEYYKNNIESLSPEKKNLFNTLKLCNEVFKEKEVGLGLKRILVFGILGVIVACVILLMKYIVSGKVHSKGDVAYNTKEYIIACFKQRKKRILISALADIIADSIDGTKEIQAGEEAMAVVAEKTLATVKKDCAKNVFIVVQNINANEEKLLKKVKATLEKQGINADYGNPYEKVEISKKFYSADSLCLLATTEKTSLMFIEEVKADSSKTNGSFAGSIVLYS
ncbi:MAG: hypothetical protein K6F97_06905 [Lachnospiraceae bacterium]|nr:hypothetical protein [Lachnospiraceae bacterium]